MSYHGKQYKGASKDLRATKRHEAEERARKNTVIRCFCGSRHADTWAGCVYTNGGAA